MLGNFVREITRKLGAAGADTGQAAIAFQNASKAIEKGDLQEAESAYRMAINLDPDSAVLRYNLGLLLHQLGMHEESIGMLGQAVTLCPDLHPAHATLFSALEMSGRLARRRLSEIHLDWARAHADRLAAVDSRSAHKSRPVRIGYVSADFRRHVVGRLIEPIIRCHDRARFHITCYSNSPFRDDMTAHLEGLADSWRRIDPLDDLQLANMIRDDGIDILVDLSGHSAGNRLLTFARRAAPMQITWMGYLNTTGMAAMDYRISDHGSDPEGVDDLYRETLLRLPHPQWCYAPDAGPIASPIVERSPNANTGVLRLACLTRFMKVTDDMVAVWVGVLKAVPAARLALIDVPRHPRGDWLRAVFREAGLSGRVKFHPTLKADEYWNLLAETDLALDTFPYTGATTTLDCLWAGVPVVTLRGECGAARSASSILSHVGLEDFSVGSEESYAEKVIELARNRENLAGIARGLRQRMLESPMCNPERFTRNLEALMESAWHTIRLNAAGGDV